MFNSSLFALAKAILLELSIINSLSFLDLRQRIRSSPYPAFGVYAFMVKPLITIGFFLCLRFFLRFQSDIRGINPFLFLAAGCIPYFMVKRICLGALGGLPGQARSLLSLRRIKAIDILIAKSYTEFRIYGLCLLLIICLVSYFLWTWLFSTIGTAILAFVLASVSAYGFSISVLFIGFRYPFLKQFVKIIVRRVLFWTSGLFFSASILPDKLKAIFLLNPLFHAIELIRYSLSPSYSIPGISMLYLFGFAFTSLGVSFHLYFSNEDELISSKNKTSNSDDDEGDF